MDLNKLDLRGLNKGEFKRGVALIKGYSIKLTRTGSEYIEGQIQSGDIVYFKAWGSSNAFKQLKAQDFTSAVVHVDASVDEYNGLISLILDDVEPALGFNASDFLPEKYSIESYSNSFKNLLREQLSDKGFALIDKMLLRDTELMHSFEEQFAASSHHDNCKGGLLAHTFKGLCILRWVLSTYPYLSCILENDNWVHSSDRVDLLVIGFALHDIGKVKEMDYGVYKPESVVTHRILGLDLLYKYRDDIEATYGLKWFRDLQSILVQHHGAFGDDCRTVVSYIVHKIDMFEANLAGLNQGYETQFKQGSAGYTAKIDERVLTL